MRMSNKSEGFVPAKERVRAAKTSEDADELARLAEDSAKSVRIEVLKNIHTPKYIRSKLESVFAYSKDAHARFAVANRTDNPDLLWKLAQDENTAVRYAVAARTTDVRLLTKLTSDASPSVQRVASNRVVKYHQ